MDLDYRVNKGFDAHDALIVGAGGTIGFLMTGGVLGTAAGLGIGYIASALADHKSYYK